MFALAIEPKARGDEVKISGALHKLAEEDPTFRSTHDAQTHEMVIHGVGELHLRVILEKMKNRFNLEVLTKPPKIAYRETITAKAEGHYRHKKQTGGAGQFGEVYLRVEPLDRGQGFEFVNEVFGGTIPGQYIPARRKGRPRHPRPTAPSPATRCRTSASSSTTASITPSIPRTSPSAPPANTPSRTPSPRPGPSLLEPIVNMEITVPEKYVGDITGDLNGRRGRINGVDTLPGGMTLIRAVAPLAEVMTYNNQLRSVTSGQGSFVMEFSHYDVVPPQVQAKIVADYKPKEEPE